MKQSFRFWIIFSYAAILIMCGLCVFVLYQAINTANDFDNYHAGVKRLKLSLFEANKLKEDVLTANVGELNFFSSGISETERRFWIRETKFRQLLSWLHHNEISTKYKLGRKLANTKNRHQEYTGTFKELIRLYKLKGFKNFGLEGQMRNHAHAIYDYDANWVKLQCLMLRRHEKDFLLRKDPAYVRQFNEVCGSFIHEIRQASDIHPSSKVYLLMHLSGYSKYFNILARIESRLGLKGHNGILHKSGKIFSGMLSDIDELDAEMNAIKLEYKQTAINRTVLFLIVLFAGLTLSIVFLTRTLTSSIKSISGAFEHYINSGFMYEAVRYRRSNIREFNKINLAFVKMAGEIQLYTNFFKEKVLERTLEINRQKEEILVQQQQIETQYKALLKKNDLLLFRKQLLLEKNRGIRDSLLYAKRIQRAILPGRTEFKKAFADAFVFYKPKDVVSGDFYFVQDYTNPDNPEDKKVLFIAADCTGHGVPGAFMSVIGINIISKLVNELGVCDPGTLTQKINTNLKSILARGASTKNKITDGMDIAVFCYHKKTSRLDYCVSRLFTHFIGKNGTVPIETGRWGLGQLFSEDDTMAATTKSMQVEPGDCLYLFSDGYVDQFGGNNFKKYKKNNLKALLDTHHHLRMSEQEEIFKAEFLNWKGSNFQTDDILLIGIRF